MTDNTPSAYVPVHRALEIPVVYATRENTAEYGEFIGTDVPKAGLSIPFYKGAVEGHGEVVPGALVDHDPRARRQDKRPHGVQLGQLGLYVGLAEHHTQGRVAEAHEELGHAQVALKPGDLAGAG